MGLSCGHPGQGVVDVLFPQPGRVTMEHRTPRGTHVLGEVEVEASGVDDGGSSSDEAKLIPKGEVTGPLVFANWLRIFSLRSMWPTSSTMLMLSVCQKKKLAMPSKAVKNAVASSITEVPTSRLAVRSTERPEHLEERQDEGYDEFAARGAQRKGEGQHRAPRFDDSDDDGAQGIGSGEDPCGGLVGGLAALTAAAPTGASPPCRLQCTLG